MINLSDIKDPAVRMRLAIAQKAPACPNCKYWVSHYWINPWCDKYKTTTEAKALDNGEGYSFCPDFHD